jgi:hypothetical protein
MTILEELFIKAKDNMGQVYAEARNDLLAEGPEAVKFLEQKISSDEPEQERWLAEIMLARAKEPNAFKELEQSFHRKALAAKYSCPYYVFRRDRSVPPRGSVLLLPGEAQSLKKENLEQPNDFLDEFDAKFFDFIEISDSPLWKPLASEILLKGWTVPAGSLWQPPIQESSRKEKHEPSATTEAWLLPSLWTPGSVLEEEEYIYQAMVLVGKLGEKRAGALVLGILQNRIQSVYDSNCFDCVDSNNLDCRAAVKVLGALHYTEALDTLLDLAENSKVPGSIRYEVLQAIGRIGDKRAIPVLQRISLWSAQSNRYIDRPENAARSAKYIIEVLEGRQQMDDRLF